MKESILIHLEGFLCLQKEKHTRMGDMQFTDQMVREYSSIFEDNVPFDVGIIVGDNLEGVVFEKSRLPFTHEEMIDILEDNDCYYHTGFINES